MEEILLFFGNAKNPIAAGIGIAIFFIVRYAFKTGKKYMLSALKYRLCKLIKEYEKSPTDEEFEAIGFQSEIYFALGGNGVIKEKIEKIQSERGEFNNG